MQLCDQPNVSHRSILLELSCRSPSERCQRSVQIFNRTLSLKVASYLDQQTFQRLTDAEKITAEELILKKAMTNGSRQYTWPLSRTVFTQQQNHDPIDLFLIECGLPMTRLTTTSIPNHRSRSISSWECRLLWTILERVSIQSAWPVESSSCVQRASGYICS